MTAIHYHSGGYNKASAHQFGFTKNSYHGEPAYTFMLVLICGQHFCHLAPMGGGKNKKD
jgi:hypothetical protein